MDRRTLLRTGIDLAGTGLEVGPLTTPIVTRDESRIAYVDHLSTEQLRDKYGPDPAVDIDTIAEVDYVWGPSRLAELLGDAAPVDYVLASHVLEHVPDMAGWLREVAEVLRPGGLLNLAVPDRRYTFDIRRCPTGARDVIGAAIEGRRRPGAGIVFDHFSAHQDIDVAALWRGEPLPTTPWLYPLGMELAEKSSAGEYVDTHCWVFSDAELLEIFRVLVEVDWFDFELASFTPSGVDPHEFYLSLRRVDPAQDPAVRRAAQLQSLHPRPTDPLEAHLAAIAAHLAAIAPEPEPEPEPEPVSPGATELLAVSPREQSLIEGKRALLGVVRRGVATARNRLRS